MFEILENDASVEELLPALGKGGSSSSKKKKKRKKRRKKSPPISVEEVADFGKKAFDKKKWDYKEDVGISYNFKNGNAVYAQSSFNLDPRSSNFGDFKSASVGFSLNW